MRTPVGTLLSGRYRLDAQVGAGGMSTVYRAFDTVLERQVAIKLMHREIAQDSDQLERFRREARAVAQLNHPHIVGVIDASEDDGMPYIVLEYVEGETLKDRIRRHGRLPIPDAVAYAIEVARALGAAHERQIVHRDVKPQNVLLDEEGTAKVTDFGIARSLADQGLTADGRVLGTTDYVSPEQALGHAVTGQSDLYSLGVVLFEMLTGDVPFHGENQVAVAMKHVREELPDVQVRRPEISSALAAVVDRATARDLGVRYATAEAMVDDLEDVLGIETARSGQTSGEVTTVLRSLPKDAQRRVPLRARTSWRVAAAVVALLVAMTVTGFYLLVGRTERGTGTQNFGKAPAPGLKGVSLKQSGARDFDPLGDNRAEHPDEAKAVVDGDARTTWSTESYTGGQLGKDGVGIYVDAEPGVAAAAMQVITPTKGFTADVYGAPPGGRPQALGDFTKVGSFTLREGQEPRRPPHRTGGATATTSCGSRRCRRRPAWRRSARSGSSAARAEDASERVGALLAVALDRERREAVDELGVGQPAADPELAVDARLGEAGHRVELVEQDRVAVDEEVRAGQALHADVAEGAHGELADALPGGGRDARGDDELHPALGVLRLVVVPAGPLEQDDLAGLARLGRPRPAQDGALDLEPGRRGLDDHARVVGQRLRDGGVDLAGLRDADDADRRAQPGRLDPAREAEAGDVVPHGLRLARPALGVAGRRVGPAGPPRRP